MKEEANIINYHHDFNMLSKPLLEAGQITEGEQNAIFWHGFQDVLQTAMAIFSDDDDFYFQELPAQRNRTNHA
jgi:hypothetical protein